MFSITSEHVILNMKVIELHHF